jgi:hypothetical protein
LIGIQERATREIKKKMTRKKEKIVLKTRDFQQSKGTVAVIFSGVPGSRSKHQDKLALRSIMAAEPVASKYLNWLQYSIHLSREDQWTNVGNASKYPLVLDPTIVGMTVTKVLIDGGAELNIIFLEKLTKMGLNLAGLITLTGVG